MIPKEGNHPLLDSEYHPILVTLNALEIAISEICPFEIQLEINDRKHNIVERFKKKILENYEEHELKVMKNRGIKK